MKIGELARASGLTIDTLRYYEKIGLLPKPMRDAGGRRHYDALTLRWIEFLKRLKQTGMPLGEMIRYAQWREQGDITAAARRQLLQAHKARVEAQKAAVLDNLAAITLKIDTYYALEAALKGDGPVPEPIDDKLPPDQRLARPRKGSHPA